MAPITRVTQDFDSLREGENSRVAQRRRWLAYHRIDASDSAIEVAMEKRSGTLG